MDTSKLYDDYYLEDEHKKSAEKRAKNLYDMAMIWDGTKFIGYFDEDLIRGLIEFNRNLKPYGVNPRLYYEFEGYNQL